MVLGTPGITAANPARIVGGKLCLFVNGTQVGDINSSGNVRIIGEIETLATLS